MKAYILSEDINLISFFKPYLESNQFTLQAYPSAIDAWKDIRIDTDTPLVILPHQNEKNNFEKLTNRIRKMDSLQKRHSFIISMYAPSLHKKDNPVNILNPAIDMHMKTPDSSGSESFETIQMFNAIIRIVNYEVTFKKQTTELYEYAEEMEHLAQQRAQQLIHADRMVTLGTMSAGIAHEINNPTSFISGNIQTIERGWNILKETFEDTIQLQDNNQVNLIIDEFPNMIEGVKKGVERITTIVKGLKLYSRQENVSKQVVNLCDCIQDALQICGAITKIIPVHTHFAQKIINVNADHTQLSQVLVNLITNAKDALTTTDNPKIDIDITIHNKTITLQFRDNGPGIPDDVLEKLFNPFFTTKDKSKGTGLGLSISEGIINDHGGTISASSDAHTGACFTITLPLVQTLSQEDTA